MCPYSTNTRSSHRYLLLLAVVQLVAGCATSPEILEGSDVWSSPDQIPPSARAQRDYQSALQTMESGNPQAATRQFEQFVAANPNWPGGYVNLAILYDQQNRTAEAVERLNDALGVDAQFVPALNQLGVISRRQGDFEAAKQYWLSATRIKPDYAYAWYNLGVLNELYLQDLRAALDNFRRYQDLVGQSGGDPTVAGWITDLERRVGRPGQSAVSREAT